MAINTSDQQIRPEIKLPALIQQRPLNILLYNDSPLLSPTDMHTYIDLQLLIIINDFYILPLIAILSWLTDPHSITLYRQLLQL